MQVGTPKDLGLYNKPLAAVHPGALAAETLPQYNTMWQLRFCSEVKRGFIFNRIQRQLSHLMACLYYYILRYVVVHIDIYIYMYIRIYVYKHIRICVYT